MPTPVMVPVFDKDEMLPLFTTPYPVLPGTAIDPVPAIVPLFEKVVISVPEFTNTPVAVPATAAAFA